MNRKKMDISFNIIDKSVTIFIGDYMVSFTKKGNSFLKLFPFYAVCLDYLNLEIPS